MNSSNIWTEETNYDRFYLQHKNPYRSTVKLFEWLESIEVIDKTKPFTLIDVACGGGGVLAYLSKIYHKASILYGIDINPQAIDIGNELYRENGITNCKIEYGNLFNLDAKLFDKFDITTILQVLLCFKDIEQPLKNLQKLNSKSLVFSTLLYEGDLTFKTNIYNHNRKNHNGEIWSLDYNTYSTNYIFNFLKSLGYKKIRYTPFEIDTDLDKYDNGYETDSYTQKWENGKRAILVGNFILNWYFVCAER